VRPLIRMSIYIAAGRRIFARLDISGGVPGALIRCGDESSHDDQRSPATLNAYDACIGANIELVVEKRCRRKLQQNVWKERTPSNWSEVVFGV
jgi:hypothetical protein